MSVLSLIVEHRMSFPSSTQNLIQQPEPAVIAEAAAVLKRGGLVALPTETVYGLGADASNAAALKHLYEVKGRPGNHPVIVHIGNSEQLSDWAQDIPEAAWKLAKAFWPGPLTLILPRTPKVPDTVTGGQDTVGIRVPNHPVALALLREFGGGIAAPSANRFGRISPTQAEHVLNDLGTDIDLILDGGACAVGVESTIVSFQNGRPIILRPGMITAEQIESVLGQQTADIQTSSAPRVSGSLASHYAPQTPVFLLEIDTIIEHCFANPSQAIGILARSPKPESLKTNNNVQWIEASSDAAVYAQQLYAHLRALDAQHLDALYVEIVPQKPEWDAIQDRLKRAAFQES